MPERTNWLMTFVVELFSRSSTNTNFADPWLMQKKSHSLRCL